MWDSYSKDHWTYSSGYKAVHVGRAKYNYRQIMVVLVVYIFLTGTETGPNEADPVARPLRDALELHSIFESRSRHIEERFARY